MANSVRAICTQRQVDSSELRITVEDEGNEPKGSTLKLLTINFGTFGDQKRRTKVEIRRRNIKNVIDISPKYDLIFAQEIPAPKSESKKLGLPELDISSFTPTKEAGLMWLDERVTLLKKVDPDIKGEAQKKVTAESIGSELNSRSTVAVLKIVLSEKESYLLLAVSWHGPHSKTELPDKTKLNKKELLQLLQLYALELVTLLELHRDIADTIDEIIIGGDFNIDLRNVKDQLVEGFQITIPTFDTKRIDGYVYKSSKHTISETQELECKGLDHMPLQAFLCRMPQAMPHDNPVQENTRTSGGRKTLKVIVTEKPEE